MYYFFFINRKIQSMIVFVLLFCLLLLSNVSTIHCFVPSHIVSSSSSSSSVSIAATTTKNKVVGCLRKRWSLNEQGGEKSLYGDDNDRGRGIQAEEGKKSTLDGVWQNSSSTTTAAATLAPTVTMEESTTSSSSLSSVIEGGSIANDDKKSNNQRSLENFKDTLPKNNGDISDTTVAAPVAPAAAGTSSSSSVSVRDWFRDTIFLGIEPTPDVIAIATIYFVEGALGLARLAQTFLLKDELHLGPAELSALTGLFTLPWTIKPLYGFLSDGFPLFGSRRRSYLILCGLLGCLSYTLVGQNFFGLLGEGNIGSGGAGTVDGNGNLLITSTVGALILSSACIAFSDVVADGIVVQKTRDSEDPKIAGGLQSLCWGSAAIGGLLSAYFSGSLLEVMKPQDVFSITAILPFLVATIAFLIQEDEQPQPSQQSPMPALTNGDVALTYNQQQERQSNDGISIDDMSSSSSSSLDGIRQQIMALWDAIRQPSIYKPALFLFLWQSTPTSDGAYLFFMTDELGFGPEFLGRVRLVAAGSSLFGVWLYNTYMKDTPIRDILFWSTIISAPLGLSNLLLITHTNRMLGIPDGAFVFGDDVVLSILGEVAFLPALVLAARLCPPGIEAVLFATLMSINNGASTVGTEIGALLTKWLGVTETNFDNLGLLTIICSLTSLYPLVFIRWLDGTGSQSENEIEQNLTEQQQEEQHHQDLDG